MCTIEDFEKVKGRPHLGEKWHLSDEPRTDPQIAGSWRDRNAATVHRKLKCVVRRVKWIQHESGSERTEKGSATLSTLFLLHDCEHKTRARLEVRQIERLGIKTGQNGNEGDGRLAH